MLSFVSNHFYLSILTYKIFLKTDVRAFRFHKILTCAINTIHQSSRIRENGFRESGIFVPREIKEHICLFIKTM